jgi:hypothetical protein
MLRRTYHRDVIGPTVHYLDQRKLRLGWWDGFVGSDRLQAGKRRRGLPHYCLHFVYR